MRRWWTFRVGEEGIRWEKASTLKTESSNVGKEASSAIGRDTAQRNEVVKRNSRRYQRKERLVSVVKPAAVGEDTLGEQRDIIFVGSWYSHPLASGTLIYMHVNITMVIPFS